MTSLVNWALLGLVIERPSYGWEFATRFQRAYGEILQVSGESHIYRAIDALLDRGLIEIVPGTDFGRQPKLHYRATEQGVRSYEDWLVGFVDAEARRQELWVRQLAIFARDPQAGLRVLGRFQQQFLKRLGDLGMRQKTGAVDTRAALIDELVFEQKRAAAGGMLSWLRSAQTRFEALARRKAAG